MTRQGSLKRTTKMTDGHSADWGIIAHSTPRPAVERT